MEYLNAPLDDPKQFRDAATSDGRVAGEIMVDQKRLARLRQLITEGLRVQLGNETITYINVGHAMEDNRAKKWN